MWLKKIITLLLLVFFLFSGKNYSFAQTATPTDTPSVTPSPTPDSNQDEKIKELQDQINQYQQKITELQGQEKTFSSQIAIMNNQIKVTELRVDETKKRIDNLEKDVEITKEKISGLEKNITVSTEALLGRIAAVYEVGRIDPWQLFLTSDNISNFLTRLKYLRLVQAYDKRTIYAAEQAKVDYGNQKSILEDKQKEEEALKKKLEGYTDQLAQEKKDKQSLLDETRGNEANYQKLIAQARTQLAGFSSFTANRGGASLLSGQTSCDDWGCYYNQRDSSWGGAALNNTQYTIASDGCLVTSMAMILTHYGHRGVTPLTINSNPDNFASYYPAYLKYTISADGVTAQRIGSVIDSNLTNGDPVVVGVHAYGGTHFVVLKSGSGGNYLMYDPYIPNGKNVNFTDHYSMDSIFEIDKVAIN
ncbi:hypothetical protein M1307_01950 [Patescibacteria group bacterium]|nr:hypothetical protein [Patescibacteria group bacterium]